MNEKPEIVVLGAGYGGIMTAINLQRILNINEASITLVNKYDYHYQTAWLHENAAGTLHHDRTRIPVDEIINTDKIHFVMDTVVCIKPEKKKVKLENGELYYDLLVIGLGFEAETFGIPGLKENAFAIGNIDSARLIREHLEYNFAMYHHENCRNPGRLNIVVGGGGFTGIEFLGELANRIPELCDEYDINKSMVRVINVEKETTILPGFDPQLAEYAMTSLVSRGVEFITGSTIKKCEPDRIVYEKEGKDKELATYTTIWAAGVRANPIVQASGFDHCDGKIAVCADMRAPGHDDVFAVGDCALVVDEKTGIPYPPSAQIAVQQATTVANNIKAHLNENFTSEKFEPRLLGTVASLGHNDAIGDVFNNWKLFGWKAVLMKKIIDNRYLFKLGGFGLLMRKGKFKIFY